MRDIPLVTIGLVLLSIVGTAVITNIIVVGRKNRKERELYQEFVKAFQKFATVDYADLSGINANRAAAVALKVMKDNK